jgi:callose synthase
MPTTILGLQEHIFTGSVSLLANYMALQETSFVTLGQPVLTKPLCIHLHYGHPDVFDKLFFIMRGISKSSKGINLSEDIFAGYNNAICGGQVAPHASQLPSPSIAK